jgi:hypothetical protein
VHHILLGMVEGWRQRRALRSLLGQTPATARLLDLTPDMLEHQGIAALALDFDGVLAPHGADRPLPETEAWLRQAVALCGAERVFVLSNRPYGPRVDWFRDQLPGVRFIGNVRKKPYCDGLHKTGELASVPMSAILMADDRLLTGCLAAIRAGCVPFYVRSPYVALRSNLCKELFFMLLRWAERWAVRLAP